MRSALELIGCLRNFYRNMPEDTRENAALGGYGEGQRWALSRSE